jgi:two-component system, chemotaxis family, protein-glutamate methylesterase/glutaminase
VIRVFVIDDSTFFRKALVRALGFDPNIRVVGEAASGNEALAKIVACRPDVATLDIDMPGLDGLSTLKELLVLRPDLPVIMLSALTRDGARVTLDALSFGAVDFIDKGSFNIMDLSTLSRELLQKINVWKPRPITSSGRVISAPVPHPPVHVPPPSISHMRPPAVEIHWENYALCTLGASTGGPPAIQKILQSVSPDFPVPIVMVQHMPAGFTEAFAHRLNTLSPLHVSEAVDGDILEQGRVFLAPAGQHLRVNRDMTVTLSREPSTLTHIPSVNVLMTSAAEARPGAVVGVLLTGMGNDGAQGMCDILRRGGLTVAEDESSCVVYGMPREAHLAGGVTHLLPLDDIVRLFQD